MNPLVIGATTLSLLSPQGQAMTSFDCSATEHSHFARPAIPSTGAFEDFASTTHLVRRRFAQLENLADGWDGPSSVAIARPALYRAERALLDALANLPNPHLPYVVPVADGGLQLEWLRREYELEVYFGPDGEVTALFELPGTDIVVEAEGAGALDLLHMWAPRVAAPRSDGGDEVASPPPTIELIAA